MYLGSLDGKDSESHGKAPESVPADGYHLPFEEGPEVSVIRVPVPPASPPSAANVAEWPALRIRHECRRGALSANNCHDIHHGFDVYPNLTAVSLAQSTDTPLTATMPRSAWKCCCWNASNQVSD